MNKKHIRNKLKHVIDEWLKSFGGDPIAKVIEENVLITGGALVSLLCGEEPNDYDVYFKTHDACLAVAQYYAEKWNSEHSKSSRVHVTDDEGRVRAFIRSEGVVSENDDFIEDESEPLIGMTESSEEDEGEEKYRIRYITSNAISLSDKIQVVLRFYGSVEEIHKYYDFVHCTCSYDYAKNEVELPARALEAIINKELYYVGSKYPLCSIIRSRKFINRGWTINAGQYVKMCLQLNSLDLHDIGTLEDQLTGVDSGYFEMCISAIRKEQEGNADFIPDDTYLFELINKIF
jgi:hypothetical protein